MTTSPKIDSKMHRLTDLFLDTEINISQEEYEHQRKQLTQKRADTIREIENHLNANDNFTECLINVVKLSSNALDTLVGSDIEGKRKLINLVFSNLKLKGEKLELKLRPPFDAFIKCTKIGEWRALKDSNL